MKSPKHSVRSLFPNLTVTGYLLLKTKCVFSPKPIIARQKSLIDIDPEHNPVKLSGKLETLD
jgi:hypothetical protein